MEIGLEASVKVEDVFFLGGDTEDRPRGLDRWPSRASGRVEGGIFGYVDRVMIGL